LITAGVEFEMPIERLEGKFKLGQNRAVEDRLGAIESLEAAGDADGVALAKFAREYLDVPEAHSI
jgi:transcriptional regulator